MRIRICGRNWIAFVLIFKTLSKNVR